MTEKFKEEVAVPNGIPKQHSLIHLVKDQARVDEDVLNHKYEGAGTTENPYVVTWIDEDAGNPMNWSTSRKWIITIIVAFECFVTAFSSSAYSGTTRELLYHFRVSTELMTAGISLFVLGFAVGPLIWAPLSEIYGRQSIFFITFAAFTAFSAGSTADNGIATLLVLRFFAGSFGSSPFTNAGGVIADMFQANERGLAMAVFSLMPSMAPTLGPFVAGFLGENEGWRWVMGLMAILTGLLWALGSLFVPETYAPVLLRKRAQALSKQTGKIYKTNIDIENGDISAIEILKTSMIRPWFLLFLEPIVLILSVYLAIVYGTLYLLFGAYPIVFQIGRGWSEGIGGLPFLGVAIGMISAVGFLTYANKWYTQAAARNGGIAPPEARLIVCMVGAVFVPIGLFWFAWTSYPSIHWMVPVAAGAPFGFGLTLIFLGVVSYLIDAYTIFAASVLAANTVLRSLFGAAFPLFTQSMYEKLGNQWGSSVPAFLALACLPAPFVLYKYGASIRARCVYASQAEEAMESLRSQTAQDSKISLPTSDAASDMGSELQQYNTSASKADGTSSIRCPQKLLRTTSRAESQAEAAAYEASPYDIDRVNTHASVAGVHFKHLRQWKTKMSK